MDFTQLTSQEFERLCGRLIQAAGNEMRAQLGRASDIGVDFTYTDSGGDVWVAEVKHFQRPRTGTTVLRHASTQLNSAKKFTGAAKALLIVSMLLPQSLKRDMELQEEIQVWDLLISSLNSA